MMLGRQLGLGQSSAFGQRNPQQCAGGEQGWGLGGSGGCAQWRLGGTGDSGQPLLCRAEDQGAACSLHAPSLGVSIVSCPVTAMLWLSKLGTNGGRKLLWCLPSWEQELGTLPLQKTHIRCAGGTEKPSARGAGAAPHCRLQIFRVTPSKGESRAGFRTRVGPAWGQLSAGLFLAESSGNP